MDISGVQFQCPFDMKDSLCAYPKVERLRASNFIRKFKVGSKLKT